MLRVIPRHPRSTFPHRSYETPISSRIKSSQLRGMSAADFAKIPRATAVGRVLNLHQYSIWVREVKFWCASLGATAIFHSHGDIRLQGTYRPRGAASWLDSKVRQRVHYFVRVEASHREAPVIDPRRSSRSSICSRTVKEDKLPVGADSKSQVGSLASLNRHAKCVLIKCDGARAVGNVQCEVA